MEDILKLSENRKTVIGVNNKSITHITIPDSVTAIGYNAFFDCSSLKSIDIPNSVTTIGKWVFNNCKSLKNINVAEGNDFYTSINGVLFNKDLTAIIRFPIGIALKEYKITNSVTTIGDSAFKGCSSLKSIDIPNSVTTIGYSAFSDCSSLKSIDIPNNVTTIGEWAFYHCSTLQSIHLHWTNLLNIQVNKCAFNKENMVNTEECTLYIPPGTRWEYRHHPVFSKFKNIEIEKQE